MSRLNHRALSFMLLPSIALGGLILGSSVSLVRAPFTERESMEHSQVVPSVLPGSPAITQQAVISSEEFPASSRRRVHIQEGTGTLTLTDSQSEELFGLQSHQPEEWGAPFVQKEQVGKVLTISVKRNGVHTIQNATTWVTATLGRPALPTDIELEGGVGETVMEVHFLHLDQVSIRSGTGSVRASFTSESLPSKALELSMGTGKASLILPKDCALQINYTLGLGSLQLRNTQLKGTGTFSTPNFEAAAKKLYLQVEAGTGEITTD